MRPQAGSWPFSAPWWPWARGHRVSGADCWEWSGRRGQTESPRGVFTLPLQLQHLVALYLITHQSIFKVQKLQISKCRASNTRHVRAVQALPG